MRRHTAFINCIAFIAAIASSVTSPVAAQQIASPSAERRIVLALDQADSAGSAHGATQRRLAIRMAHAAIVHRLRVELVDAQGNVVEDGARWDVTIWNAAAGSSPLATLDEAHPELRVPRPYGLRLNAEDSLTVAVDVRALGAAGSTLRAIVDYELPESAGSRLPVLALSSSRAVLDAPAQDAWTWQPAVNGRLVAVSGEALARADEIVLEDATTGAVLWRTRVQRPSAAGTAYRQEQIRPGVTLEEGRAYRLRTIYAAGTTREASAGTPAPLAVLMPATTPVARGVTQ
jgi:hypothetical protein